MYWLGFAYCTAYYTALQCTTTYTAYYTALHTKLHCSAQQQTLYTALHAIIMHCSVLQPTPPPPPLLLLRRRRPSVLPLLSSVVVHLFDYAQSSPTRIVDRRSWSAAAVGRPQDRRWVSPLGRPSIGIGCNQLGHRSGLVSLTIRFFGRPAERETGTA